MPVGTAELANIAIEKFLGVRIGESAPDFTVTTISGDTLRLSDLRGKVVLLDFWATWCAPCIAQMPHLRTVHERFGAGGDFVIVGISLDESDDPVRRFMSMQSIPWPITVQGPADDNPVAKAYNVSQIPATFLIDREGKVAARDLHGTLLDAQVAKLVGSGSESDSQTAASPP